MKDLEKNCNIKAPPYIQIKVFLGNIKSLFEELKHNLCKKNFNH
jgi:hypothetical protein